MEYRSFKILSIIISIALLVVTIYVLLQQCFKNSDILEVNTQDIKKDFPACKDNVRQLDCINWKQHGYCDKNPAYMIQNCASTCEMCHLVDPEVRCKKFHTNQSVFKNDEMYNMFNDLEKYFPLLDCGTIENNDENVCANNQKNLQTINIISSDPWIITIDNFLTEKEADTIKSIPTENAFVQSTAAGAYQANGVIKREISDVRTSRNAWCQVGCDDHPIVQNVLKRMSNTVNVPISNFEHLQILRLSLFL